MQTEDVAQDNLRAFSQNTQYLFDWCRTSNNKDTPAPSKKYLHSNKKSDDSESPHKLEHKKYEKKQDLLHRFEYPIVEEQTKEEKPLKSFIKSRGQLKLIDFRKDKEKRQKQSKIINQLVEDEFNKVTQQVFTSLNPHPHPLKVPPVPSLKKGRTNSLPFIVKKRVPVEE